MSKIIFILGGARSGKSNQAVKLAQVSEGKVAFIATGQAKDKEMQQRIKLHKQNRPAHWHTFENPTAVAALLKKIGPDFDILIIDCLTLFISNLLSKGLSDMAIESEISCMLKIASSLKAKIIIIANEVGLGIVPKNKLGRRFRDLAGRVNQKVAEKSAKTFFVVSGLALKIKGR